MNNNNDKGGGPVKGPASEARQDRLKLALRENLKRRKSQARGRGDVPAAPSEDDKGGKERGR